MSDTTAELPRLRLHLPGEWWQVPLHDASAARASIRSLVDRQVGPADDRAIVRDRLRAQFFAAISGAIESDGQALHLALDVIDGTPLSTSLAVFLPPIAMTPAVGTSSAAVAEMLEAGIRAAPGKDLSTLVTRQVGRSTTLRLHRREVMAVVGDDGSSAELDTVIAEYWVTIPGTKRVMLLVFTTAFAELEDVMLDFFDRIVRVIQWDEPEPRH